MSGSSGSSSDVLPFVKVRRVRSFDDVVDQVRTAIIDGSITAGERLPSERELAEQFGVSRATLREALRALEAVGLIEIRLGAHGGAFATETPGQPSIEPLRTIVDLEATANPGQARLLRASVHADNATWAARTPEHLAALTKAVPQGTATFLVALARASGMPFRVALATAVEHGDAVREQPELSATDMEQAVDLLREGRQMECRDLLFRLMRGPAGPEDPQ